jgi:hypothetical protein
MTSSSLYREGGSAGETEDNPHRHLGENVLGALIMITGSIALVVVTWGVMVAVTSPQGWVTKAANTVIAGEAATVLTSYREPGNR